MGKNRLGANRFSMKTISFSNNFDEHGRDPNFEFLTVQTNCCFNYTVNISCRWLELDLYYFSSLLERFDFS